MIISHSETRIDQITTFSLSLHFRNKLHIHRLYMKLPICKSFCSWFDLHKQEINIWFSPQYRSEYKENCHYAKKHKYKDRISYVHYCSTGLSLSWTTKSTKGSLNFIWIGSWKEWFLRIRSNRNESITHEVGKF